MMMRRLFAGCFCACVVGPALSLTYDEAVDGDLSNDPNAPTVLDFDLGSNLISGNVFNSNDLEEGDREFFTFTIDPGQRLTGIFLTELNPFFDVAFHAISEGTTSVAAAGPDAGDVSTYLGGDHLVFSSSTTNLLPGLGNALGGMAGSGFDTDFLGPGTYTYHLRQGGLTPQDYTLDFVVDVPEPSSLALVALGGVGLMRRRRG